jgi:hypothetical protein
MLHIAPLIGEGPGLPRGPMLYNETSINTLYMAVIIVTLFLECKKNCLKIKDKEYKILDKIHLMQHFGKNHMIRVCRAYD